MNTGSQRLQEPIEGVRLESRIPYPASRIPYHPSFFVLFVTFVVQSVPPIRSELFLASRERGPGGRKLPGVNASNARARSPRSPAKIRPLGTSVPICQRQRKVDLANHIG